MKTKQLFRQVSETRDRKRQTRQGTTNQFPIYSPEAYLKALIVPGLVRKHLNSPEIDKHLLESDQKSLPKRERVHPNRQDEQLLLTTLQARTALTPLHHASLFCR